MKKLYIILFVTLVTFSCEKIDLFDFCVEDCTFEVHAYTRDNVPFDVYDYIDAPDGWKAKWGKTLVFEALDPPGYQFVGWYNDPKRSYCYRVEPIVDPENFRITYVQGDIMNMNGCNNPNRSNYLAAKYVRIN